MSREQLFVVNATGLITRTIRWRIESYSAPSRGEVTAGNNGWWYLYPFVRCARSGMVVVSYSQWQGHPSWNY